MLHVAMATCTEGSQRIKSLPSLHWVHLCTAAFWGNPQTGLRGFMLYVMYGPEAPCFSLCHLPWIRQTVLGAEVQTFVSSVNKDFSAVLGMSSALSKLKFSPSMLCFTDKYMQQFNFCCHLPLHVPWVAHFE